MKRAFRIYASSFLACVVLFVFCGASNAQINCPTPDTKALQPGALVESPLITVRFQPQMENSVLSVPARVEVSVERRLKPVKVELWTGPTGTEVAEFYCRMSSNDHAELVGQRMRFVFDIADCKQVKGVLEPRVFVLHRSNPYSVYVGPFECRSR